MRLVGVFADFALQNYIDPRLSVVFSSKMGVPIERLFPKTLREKFNWAIQSIGDDSTWEF